MTQGVGIRRLGPGDLDAYRAMMALFGRVFDEPDTYQAMPPGDGYVTGRLDDPTLILLVAERDGQVIGGLAAYELKKFERPRSEVYIYDLAVDASYRRQGIATRLINRVRRIARDIGGWVVYVQADGGDTGARALYDRFGVSEDVVHIDITVDDPQVP